MDKCVCGYKAIKGVCDLEECNSISRLKDNINANPNTYYKIDPIVDESNSFGDLQSRFTNSRSGNYVDESNSFRDPIIDPSINLEEAALVALCKTNKKRFKKC